MNVIGGLPAVPRGTLSGGLGLPGPLRVEVPVATLVFGIRFAFPVEEVISETIIDFSEGLNEV